jgi:hypothetical protein
VILHKYVSTNISEILISDTYPLRVSDRVWIMWLRGLQVYLFLVLLKCLLWSNQSLVPYNSYRPYRVLWSPRGFNKVLSHCWLSSHHRRRGEANFLCKHWRNQTWRSRTKNKSSSHRWGCGIQLYIPPIVFYAILKLILGTPSVTRHTHVYNKHMVYNMKNIN